MRKLIFILCFCSVSIFPFTEKNIKIYSKSMKKDIPVTVILPDGYSNNVFKMSANAYTEDITDKENPFCNK